MSQTVVQIIQAASRELGLPSPTSVIGSTNGHVVQMLALLTALGEELINEHDWEMLTATQSVTTVPSQSAYSLPTDWVRYINDTNWNTTKKWPVYGPKTPSEWATLTNSTLVNTSRLRFRVKQQQLQFSPTPTSVDDLTIEYISNKWVIAADTSKKTSITADSDKFVFADRLLINGVKLKFFEVKGFDTTVLEHNYARTLADAKGTVGGPVIVLTSQPDSDRRRSLIDEGDWGV